MEWGDFLKIALTSSLFSAVVTTGANYYFKKQDYKRDYYKKIIDKRLKAYEELESFMGSFCLKQEVSNPLRDEKDAKSFEVLRCFTEDNGLIKANDDILKVLKYSLWFSNEICENLGKINSMVCEVGISLTDTSSKLSNEIRKSGLTGKLAKEDLILYMGHVFFDDIQTCIKELGITISKDLTNIHDVESFLKRISK